MTKPRTETVTGPVVDEVLGTEHPEPDPKRSASGIWPAPQRPSTVIVDGTERPATTYWTSLVRAQAYFESVTADHTMTVLHDVSGPAGSPYRHLRFAAPKSRFYYFDIVTWPGHLHVGGDFAPYTFRRLHDMMDFFNGTGINPGYWGEKVVCGQTKDDFDFEVYEEHIRNHLDDASGWYSESNQALIRDAVHNRLIDLPPTDEREARELLDDFEVRLPSDRNFQFADTWEWDLGGYSHHFLMSCHAVAYAVREYRRTYPHRITAEV